MLDEPKARDLTLDSTAELAALIESLPEHHKRWVALAAFTGWRRMIGIPYLPPVIRVG